MRKLLLFLSLALLLVCNTECSRKPADSSWIDNSIVYEFNTRQMTPDGTFAAAEKHLPRLKSLGVDIIWLMPIYPIGELERKGTLGSYYAIRDYCDVNPEFGTLEDFDHFLKAAHKEGLKVILDWVANHTSPDHPWVTEKPADWYVRDSLGRTIVEYDWTDIAKLNYNCPDVPAAMCDCMRFWLNRGIDGFRCDVAYQLPRSFWSETISALRNESPKPLYFLAEGEETWLHEVGFDATYSWKLHHLLNDIAQGNATVQDLREYVAWNEENFPAPAHRLTFTSNHDENSWSGTEFERMGDAWKAMTVLDFTLPGSQPLIYSAQEIGYDHRFEFFEKDPVPAELWAEDSRRSAYTDFYSQLIDFYEAHPVLWPGQSQGTFEFLPDDSPCLGDDGNWLGFRRTLGDDDVTIYVHLAEPWEFGFTPTEK